MTSRYAVAPAAAEVSKGLRERADGMHGGLDGERWRLGEILPGARGGSQNRELVSTL